MTTQHQNSNANEMVRKRLEELVPIDNFKRNRSGEFAIAASQRASLFLFSKLGTPAFKELLPIGIQQRQQEAVYDELVFLTSDKVRKLDNPALLFEACRAFPVCKAKTPKHVFDLFATTSAHFGKLPGLTASSFLRFPDNPPADFMRQLAFNTVLKPLQSRLRALNKAVGNRCNNWRMANFKHDSAGRLHSPEFPCNMYELFPCKSSLENLNPDCPEQRWKVRWEGEKDAVICIKDNGDITMNHNLLPPDLFPEHEYRLHSDLDLMHRYLRGFARSSLRGIPICSAFETVKNPWACVYSFSDDFGQCRQKALKFLDEKHMLKLIVPVIYHRNHREDLSDYYCTALPGLQPLYNLKKLRDYPEHTVIFADTVELAAANAGRTTNPITWTSCLPQSPQDWDQVDWTPLENRTVYYLISNHSGKSLEEMTFHAKTAADALEKHADIPDLRFAIAPVRYPEVIYCDFKDYVDHCNLEGFVPQAEKEQIRIYNRGEFENVHRRAQQRTELLRIPYYLDRDEIQPAKTEEEDERPTNAFLCDYVLRPLLKLGQTTLLYAPAGLGKSSFCLSVCGCVISGLVNEYAEENAKSKDETSKSKKNTKPIVGNQAQYYGRWLIKGKCWPVPKNIRMNASAIYFDFEPRDTYEILDWLTEKYLHPYLPPKYREQCLRRFKYVMCNDHAVDLLTEEGAAKIVDEIETFEGKEPRFPVKLAVFDNYSGILGNGGNVPDNSNTFNKIHENVFEKLQEKGIAVLLVDHAARKESNKKEYREGGSKRKTQVVGQNVRMDRPENKDPQPPKYSTDMSQEEYDGKMGEYLAQMFEIREKEFNEGGTLREPMRMQLTMGNFGIAGVDSMEFWIKWGNCGTRHHRWRIHDPEYPFLKEWKAIVDNYMNEKVDTEMIQNMMGFSNSKFDEINKKAQGENGDEFFKYEMPPSE